MKDKLKVEGHTHLVRDLKSQAIINTDSKYYEHRYMARKAKQQKKDDRNLVMLLEISIRLKNEMREIKFTSRDEEWQIEA